jgi:hypothetical protein
MKKVLRPGAIVALVLAVSAITAASASSPSHRDHGRSVEVLHLVSTTVQESPEPTEPPVVGDEFAFSDDIFERGKKVGILGGQGTFVRFDEAAQSATVNVVATAQLPRGQLTMQGLVTFSEEGGGRFSLAVTGGTGRYRTAHGEAFVRETEDEDTVEVKVVIIR